MEERDTMLNWDMLPPVMETPQGSPLESYVFTNKGASKFNISFNVLVENGPVSKTE